MHWQVVIALSSLRLAVGQGVGTYLKETHPKLQWSTCTVEGGCESVNGELVMDANFRWLHAADSDDSCYSGNTWNHDVCNTTESCTDICVVDGASYEKGYGVIAANDSVSLNYFTSFDFSHNIGSRLFLLESTNKYQTFTLLNNELAFDVDLSTVECGINSALYFVPMDPDGGQSRYPTNKAGPEYGTGYCDSSCTRGLKFVGGKANVEAWFPAEYDDSAGIGLWGSCCPQFSVWNSNAHSFAMSSHICGTSGHDVPFVCEHPDCGFASPAFGDRFPGGCAPSWLGCSYNPYQMGNTDFYGKGKKVDTARKFTVVTRWDATKVTQFFIQDGQKIDMPTPTWEGMPEENGLSAEMCFAQPVVFNERALFEENGGWEMHVNEILKQPMVLTMSIDDDHYAWNTWLDSVFPPYDGEAFPGYARGDCLPYENNNPVNLHGSNAKVIWSNIRFGPIGSTVKV